MEKDEISLNALLSSSNLLINETISQALLDLILGLESRLSEESFNYAYQVFISPFAYLTQLASKRTKCRWVQQMVVCRNGKTR